MKRLLVVGLWVPVAMISLLVCLHVYAANEENESKKISNVASNITQPYQMYKSVPKVLGEQAPNAFYIQSQDIMPRLIELYLRKNNSPVLDSYQDLILIAQEYGVDPIFMVSIAQCESNLGKKMPHEDSNDPYSCHNPFGWGIHSQGTLCFDTWQDGYKAVAEGLRKKYFNQGYDSTEDIMIKYTPPALEKQGSWAKCVNHFIDDLNNLREEM